MSKAGEKLISAVKEAVAVARGEKPPARVSMTVRGYRCRFAWSDEDQGFVGIVDQLPGCSAVGSTWTEAAAEIGPAIDAWISAAQAAGNPIPHPHRSGRPSHE